MDITDFNADTQIKAQMSSSAFEWLEAFAGVTSIGIAIIQADLAIEFTNNFLQDILELSERPTRFTDILNTLSQRGDFGDGDPNVSQTAILKALDMRLSSGESSAFSIEITTPSGLIVSLRFQALADQRVLIAAQPERLVKKNNHDYFQEVLDMADSGYWTFSVATKSFQIKAAGCLKQLFPEHDIQETLQSIWSLVHPDDVSKTRAAIAACMQTLEQNEIVIRMNNSLKQPNWLKLRLRPVLSSSGDVETVVCFFTDISHTLHIQNQLRQSSEKFEKAFTAKNSFLGRLSHEIRTPMNAVIGISDALLHHHNDPAINPKLELIQESAEKIIRIVDETLQHTKLDEDRLELNPRHASPHKSVETVCQLWEDKAVKENIDLRCEINPSVPDTIYFDDYRYEQCLNNLLSNAVKFTAGGAIHVMLTCLEKNGQQQLVLAVKDTGIGMTPEQQASVFDAFTQADKSISSRFGGTGLGMNITKRIIELMGGKISLRSVEGKGTVFALSLPIVSADQAPVAENSGDLVEELIDEATTQKSDYSALSILVADDNNTNHMVVSSLLGSIVKDIHIAENGEEAIKILETTPVDLVLMDIHMPVMDGIEATLSIRGRPEAWSQTPIIALTADPQYQQKRLCRNIGMNAALAKPVRLTEILSAIDEVVGRNDEQDPAVQDSAVQDSGVQDPAVQEDAA